MAYSFGPPKMGQNDNKLSPENLKIHLQLIINNSNVIIYLRKSRIFIYIHFVHPHYIHLAPQKGGQMTIKLLLKTLKIKHFYKFL